MIDAPIVAIGGIPIDALSTAASFDAVASVVSEVDFEPAHVVGAGGAIGAVCRHWVYERLSGEGFPRPTLVVNVVGSFVLALAAFAGAGETTTQLLGIGACGSFTTFSSFSVETVQLWEREERRLAIANAAANLLASLAAIGLAWAAIGFAGP